MEEIRVDMRQRDASVVTHDVGDYEVVVGSHAKVLKTLDAEKFNKKVPSALFYICIVFCFRDILWNRRCPYSYSLWKHADDGCG